MHVRQLTPVDVPSALALANARPYSDCFLISMLERNNIPGIVGIFSGDTLVAIASTGANCVTTDLTAETASALASYLAREGRRSASIVGRKSNVELLWRALDGRWGTSRDVRESQPLLILRDAAAIPADPLVRRATPDELELVFPACVHMFRDEVGVDPLARGMGGAYRERVQDIIANGRSFVRIVNGVVEFKTEIGATSSAACQLQGVWVAPHLRGRGLAAPGLAAVTAFAMADIAPAVELYVNDFNSAALRTYERVGFEHHDTFSTVFF